MRNGTTWSQQAYLKASNTETFDQFGISVALSGDTAVVGASWEASNATGIDGDQSSNTAPNSGAAYVFVRSGSTWSQQAYLKGSNTEAPVINKGINFEGPCGRMTVRESYRGAEAEIQGHLAAVK